MPWAAPESLRPRTPSAPPSRTLPRSAWAPYCPGTEFVFASTIYSPTVKATVTVGLNSTTSKSDMRPFVIPAVDLITPINERFSFGRGMFGITGMGVDYRNKGIDLNPMPPPAPSW